MKIYVCVDMEGISGIARWEQVTPGTAAYEAARGWMTEDANACVAGCFDGGATAVTVRDMHGNGSNILWDRLDGRARLIQQGWMVADILPGLKGHDAVILLGYHPMAATPHGTLEHTCSHSHWQNFWMNKTRCGEIALHAAMAGDCGLPVVMVSGSAKTCTEARRFLPGVVTAEVKRDLDLEGADFLSRDAAHRLLCKQSAAAMKAMAAVKPYRVKHPVTMRLEKVSHSRLPEGKPGVRIIDGRTYEVTGRDVLGAYNML